jgi:hypothetical protein
MIDILGHRSVTSAIMFTILLVVGRLLINRHLESHARGLGGHPVIPRSFLLLALVGFGGLVVTWAWALASVGWEAALGIFALYTITCFLPSSLVSASADARPLSLMASKVPSNEDALAARERSTPATELPKLASPN